MGTNRSGETGVTSVDVVILMGQLNEAHYGRTIVELEPLGMGASARPRYVVRAANFVGVHRSPRNTRMVVEATWPSAGHRTLASCMFHLLYRLDAALEEARRQTRGGVTPLEAAIEAAVITDNL